MQAHPRGLQSPLRGYISAYPICIVCDLMVHTRFSAPERLEVYREKVMAGFMPAPGS